MRIRTIKPGFWANEDLGSLPALTRLLAIGLLNLADREGRLEDRPKRIGALLLPYEDTCDVNAMLEELESIGYLSRYEVENKSCIQILTFSEHQRPNIKEPPSTIPAPTQHEKNRADTKKNSKTIHASIPVIHSLPVPIPDQSEDQDQDLPAVNADQLPDGDHIAVAVIPTTADYPEPFEQAWRALPKRAGNNPKRKALHAWRGCLQRNPDIDANDLIDAADRYRQFCDGTDKTGTEKVLMGATFFGPDDPWNQAWILPRAAPRLSAGMQEIGRMYQEAAERERASERNGTGENPSEGQGHLVAAEYRRNREG